MPRMGDRWRLRGPTAPVRQRCRATNVVHLLVIGGATALPRGQVRGSARRRTFGLRICQLQFAFVHERHRFCAHRTTAAAIGSSCFAFRSQLSVQSVSWCQRRKSLLFWSIRPTQLFRRVYRRSSSDTGYIATRPGKVIHEAGSDLGSEPTWNTTGIDVVAAFAANAAGVLPAATIRCTCRRTSSSARAGNRSLCSSAHRYSIVTV